MRTAVLGLGFMGSTHVRALQHIPLAQLAAIYSSSEAKRAGDLSGIQGNLGTAGQQHDFSAVKQFRDMEALLADPDIDAVDICLPTYLHAEVGLRALHAGKHVFLEKPFALSGADADMLIAEAERQHRVLMVGHVLRFLPMYTALSELLHSRRLGSPRTALFRRRCAAPAWSAWLTDPHKSGGGVFDLLIHDVDICLHLFGLPEAVSATGYCALAAGIDIIDATLFYPDDLTVTIQGGWHHPRLYPFSMEYTVVADGGTVEYSSLGSAPTLYTAGAEQVLLPQADEDGHRAELAYFLDCCARNSEPTRCLPRESAQAVKLMQLILSARERKGVKLLCKI